MKVPTVDEINSIARGLDQEGGRLLLQSLRASDPLVTVYTGFLAENGSHSEIAMYCIWAAMALGFQLGAAWEQTQKLEALCGDPA